MPDSVLFIILDKTADEDAEMLLEQYGPLLTHIAKTCRIHDVRTYHDAMEAMSWDGVWRAIIIMEPTVVGTRFQVLSDKIVSYAKNGGTVIFEGRFGRLLRPKDLDGYFRDVWNLSWRYGAQNTEEWEYTFNSTCVMKRMADYRYDIPRTYRFAGLQLANVPIQDSVYLPKWPLIGEREQKGPELIFGGCTLAETDKDRWQRLSPIVFAKYERGCVGWVGDDKHAYKFWTIEILAAMCGL